MTTIFFPRGWSALDCVYLHYQRTPHKNLRHIFDALQHDGRGYFLTY